MPLARQEFPQYLGIDSKLLFGGTVSYWEADANGNLTTEKPIYSDPAMTIPYSSNELELDSLGSTEYPVYLTYPYGVIVKDKNDDTVKVIGWVDSESSSSSSGQSLGTISELRAFTGQSDGDVIYISGYHSFGDQGGGTFVWFESSTVSDNNGTVIAPNSAPANGRWIRQVDDYLTPFMFGAIPNDSSIDCAPYFVNLASEASAGLVKRDIYIPDGDYNIGSSFSMTGSFNVTLGNVVRFSTTDTPTSWYNVAFNCNGFYTSQLERMVDYSTVRLLITTTKSVEVNAEWFGLKSAVTDSTLLTHAYEATSSNNTMVITGEWSISGSNDINTGIKTVFRDSGEWDALVGNSSVLNIGDISNERTDGEPCIVGEYSEWTLRDDEYTISCFASTVSSNSDANFFVYLYNAITVAETKSATIKWDYGSYSFGTMTAPDGLDLVRNIADGAIVNGEGLIPVYNLVNNDIKLFDPTMSGYALVNSDLTLITCGGISRIDESINSNNHALELAIRSLAVPTDILNPPSDNLSLDLNGCDYLLTDSASVITGFTKEITIKNGSLRGVDSFLSPISGLISTDNDLIFDNVKLVQTVAQSTTVGGLVVNTSGTLKFRNCYVEASDGSTQLGFVVGYPVSADNTIFENCSINNIHPSNSKITNCKINGLIGLLATDTDYTVENLIIKDNVFNTDSGNPQGGIFVSGSFTSFGHQYVTIKDNVFGNNDKVATTEYRKATLFGAGSSPLSHTEQTTDMVFPLDERYANSATVTSTYSSTGGASAASMFISNHTIDSFTGGIWTITFYVGSYSWANTPANILLNYKYTINDQYILDYQ